MTESESEMDESDTESEYVEPSEDELIQMMRAIPLEHADGGWDKDMPEIVLPLSLTQFMDAFWVDYAPFYLPAFLTRK